MVGIAPQPRNLPPSLPGMPGQGNDRSTAKASPARPIGQDDMPVGEAPPPDQFRCLIQASTAGNALALRSAEIAIVSVARATITRPPEVACAGAKAASAAAWPSSLKLVMKFAMN